MLQKYSFFCIFALLLTGFHWWSSRVEISSELLGRNGLAYPAKEDAVASASMTDTRMELRRNLLETLDRLVELENQYRSFHGHYTQVLNNLGYEIPQELVRHYEIRISRASKSG